MSEMPAVNLDSEQIRTIVEALVLLAYNAYKDQDEKGFVQASYALRPFHGATMLDACIKIGKQNCHDFYLKLVRTNAG